MARGDGTIKECGASLVSSPDVAVVLVVGGNRWRGGFRYRRGMEGVSGQPPHRIIDQRVVL